MAKVKPVSEGVRKGFRGILAFRNWKGIIRAGIWPQSYKTSQSEPAKFGREVWKAACREYKELKPSVVNAYKLLAGGTGFTWRDLFNSQYMLEYYKAGVEPAVVRDFSYTKTGPRINIIYELSKENLVSVTRHPISRYDVKVPSLIGKHSPGCNGPPDPEPDQTAPQCEFSGNVNFIPSPTLGIAKQVYCPENENGFDWTYEWLIEHWKEAEWESEEIDDVVAWYAAIGVWLPTYYGRIKGKKITLIIHLTEAHLGVLPADVTKAWIECEGSILNFYISGFKCVETGDLVPLQAGKVAFGDLMPYIGLPNQWFHMQPIEMPDPPTQPIEMESGMEVWSGGTVRANTFKCKFCYEQKITIPYESLGALEWKWTPFARPSPIWWIAWENALEDWAEAKWTTTTERKWPNFASASGGGIYDYTARIWTFRQPIIYRIGDHCTPEQFESVKWGRVMLPRSQSYPRVWIPGGEVRVNINPVWVKQIDPITEILIPKACLTYPNTTLLLECNRPRVADLRPGKPTQGHDTRRGYDYPDNPKPPLVLYQKGDRSHILNPPWNWNSPYWLKFSQQDEFEPVVSPFFRIT